MAEPAQKLQKMDSGDAAVPLSSLQKSENAIEVQQPDAEQILEKTCPPTSPPKKTGLAAVKPEFICPVVQYVDGDKSSETCSETSSAKGDRPKHVRGQNKNRKKVLRPKDSDQLCQSVINTGNEFSECKFGEKCRFLHDLKEYLKRKEKDISVDGMSCPFFDQRGRCPFGISCRFAGDHFYFDTLELESKEDTEKWELWQQRKFPDGLGCNFRFVEQNSVSNELMKALRKGKFDFSRSDSFLKRLEEDKKSVATAVENETENGTSLGPVSDEDAIKLRNCERKNIDWAGKRYLAPLTTVGNLPFRRVCVELGAEITCSEMAVATSLLQGTQSEWSLIKRHETEKIFGVQLCGSHSNSIMRATQVLVEKTEFDFLDLNMGCPIDLVCNKGGGCSLMNRLTRLNEILDSMYNALEPAGVPLTLKFRTGLQYGKNSAHTVLEKLKEYCTLKQYGSEERVALYTMHGRSKEQRYTKLADWDYIEECARVADPVPFFGCGDVLSYEEYYEHLEKKGRKMSGIMIARGALIKPWIFTEIEERRHWDISSGERLDILRKYAKYGLEHWGSDHQGVEKTRRFLLEWLSFFHRYIPVGLLERLPQKMNEKPPKFFGRNDLETLMASTFSDDWVKLSEMILGPVPNEFQFVPKHKANSYA